MKYFSQKLVLPLFLIATPTVFAQTGGIEGVGESIHNASNAAGSSNDIGSAMSGLTAAKLAGESARHFSRCPKSSGDCAMGALKALMSMLSMMQMGAHGNTSGMAGISSGLTDGTTYTPVESGAGVDDSNNPLMADADFKALKDNMAKLQNGIAGSKLDTKKGVVTMADGTTLSLKDISSAEAMAAAGLPPGAIAGLAEYNKKLGKEIQDKMDKLKLGALTDSSGFAEGGGGGGGVGGGIASEMTAAAPAAVPSEGKDRDPSSLSGLQKNYNGEPIGVAADSIFHMMARRYKLKESQGSFFTDADIALQK